MSSDFAAKRRRLDAETDEWFASASRRVRKAASHLEHCENKRMKAAEDRSILVELHERESVRQLQSESSRRPGPRFQTGQSVHQYWASWFSGCRPGSEPQISKNKRPGWYSAEISGAPTWKEELPYAGSLITGWTYLVYWWNGRSERDWTPEQFLRPLPDNQQALQHSNGRLTVQSPPPEFWQHYNHNKLWDRQRGSSYLVQPSIHQFWSVSECTLANEVRAGQPDPLRELNACVQRIRQTTLINELIEQKQCYARLVKSFKISWFYCTFCLLA